MIFCHSVEKNDKDVSKPVPCHVNLPNHSKKRHGYLRPFSTSRWDGKPLARIWNKNSFSKSAPLILTVLTNAFQLTNIFLFFTLPCYHQ